MCSRLHLYTVSIVLALSHSCCGVVCVYGCILRVTTVAGWVGGGMSRWGEGTVVVFSRMLLQAHTARSRGMLGISINPRIKRDERVALCCRPHSLATHRHPRPPPARAYSPLPLTCAPYMLVRLLLEVNDIGVWFLRGWKNTIFHCISSMRIPYLKYLV